MKKILVILLLQISTQNLFAAEITNSNIRQKNTGSVEAKLDVSNIFNSIIQQNVAGNSFYASPTAKVNAANIAQENIGNITSSLNRTNVFNESIQKNVAGTVIVIN